MPDEYSRTDLGKLYVQLGMVLEPGGVSNQMVTGTSTGELKFIDFRVVGSTGQMGVWKSVEAHTKGAMTAMAAHPYSPLLATATATQVTAYSTAAPQLRLSSSCATGLLISTHKCCSCICEH